MKIQKIYIEFVAAAILFVIVVWIIFASSSASTGKPTEKTHALLSCRSFLVMAAYAAGKNHSVFEVKRLNSNEKSDLWLLSQSWHNGADFLFKTNFSVQSSTREIVIVSNWKLDAARPTIWNFFHKNPAHVVGYSDGTTGLVSPEQFANLNLNGFVSLSSLATNSELKISKP